MLYTRKGDDGTTRDFSAGGNRKSKSSLQMEVLGSLDELNSFLGLVKVKAVEVSWLVKERTISDIILSIQKDLFIIQAEIAGADKRIGNDKVKKTEEIIDSIEKEIPTVKSFLISGGTELTALLDVSRTLARKVERRIIAARESGEIKTSDYLLSYINRLSSLIYALARLSSYKSGIKEESPDYR